MRPIDADALCEGLVTNHPVVIAAKCAPTIDAVEVVRCKDCKHWQPEPMGDVKMCYKGALGRWTKPDFFCADGERLEAHDG